MYAASITDFRRHISMAVSTSYQSSLGCYGPNHLGLMCTANSFKASVIDFHMKY